MHIVVLDERARPCCNQPPVWRRRLGVGKRRRSKLFLRCPACGRKGDETYSKPRSTRRWNQALDLDPDGEET